MKKILFRLIGVLIVLAAAWAAYSFVKQFDTKQEEIATALVRQSDVIIRTYTRGELRAVRSSTLTAPNLFGTVQITRLAPLGAVAKDKDLIVEFDDSEVQSRLEEKELEMEQLDEQLKKATAELEIRNNQDQVELLKARYSVRRSELEVKRNELLSDIDQKKNLLTLQESQRRLKQLESDIKSRLDSSQAELAVLRERKNKAVLELQREKSRLMQVKLLSPMSGLVAIRQSRPMGGLFYPGMQLPDYREGDQVFPGTPVADVLDLSELEVAAKVGELDRANLNEGQDVTMRLDAVPEKVFHGKIKNLSGTASANVWSADPAKKFDVLLSVDMRQLLSGLGASPEQVKRVLETAERNRSKPAAAGPMMARLGGPGGMPGGAPGMVVQMSPGGPGGPEAGASEGQAGQGERRIRRGGGEGGGREGREGGGREGRVRGEGGGREGGAAGESGERRRFGGNLSEDQQKQLRDAMQKLLAGRNPQDLTPEDQQKMREEMRKLFQGMGAGGGGQRQGGGEGGAPGAGGMRVFSMQRPGSGEGGPGAAGGAPGASPGASPMMMPMGFGMGSSQQFTEKDLANAKLPPPPEEDNQLEVLLRPGLLADVEIIVDKVPNAINIPVQAVFDKEGKPIVFVKKGDQFEERLIKPLKRSESTMVISEGLKAGEIVALKDPTRSDQKKGGKDAGKKPGGVPAAPAGGGRAS